MGVNTQSNAFAAVRDLLANALEIPIERVGPDLAFGDLPEWDSMGHMSVMVSLEQRFGVQINSDTIAQLTSLPAITTYLDEHDHVPS